MPGFFFISAINSSVLETPSVLGTTSTLGCVAAMLTRSRSFAGSYGIFLKSRALTPSGPAMLTPIVCPSGAALAIASVPRLPAAPALFSTITGWPLRLASRSPTMRAMMSGVEPGP